MKVNGNLDTLVFSITDLCNLNCYYCSRDAGFKNNTHLSANIIKKAFDDISKIKTPRMLGISGGEPLLHPGLFEILKTSKKYGFKTRVSTNATLLTSIIVERLRDLDINQINTSLDGPRSEINDKIRGNGSFDKIMNGIKCMQEAEMNFFIKSTITKLNIKYIPDIFRLAIDMGSTGFAVSGVIQTGRASSSEQIPWSEYKDIIRKCIKISEDSGSKFVIDDPLKFLIDPAVVNYITETYGGFEKVWGGCIAGISILYIASNGDIIPCPALPTTVGNIYRDNLANVWLNSDTLRCLRDRSNLNGLCRKCKYTYVCGGCRARAYSHTGNVFGDDPFCPILHNRI